MAAQAYQEREVQYPVMAGFYRFSRADGSGQRKIDRDELAAWARERFQIDLAPDDFRNRQREEIQSVLLDASRAWRQKANEALAEVKRRIAELRESRGSASYAGGPTGGNGKLSSLADWLNQNINAHRSADELARLDFEKLEHELVSPRQLGGRREVCACRLHQSVSQRALHDD